MINQNYDIIEEKILKFLEDYLVKSKAKGFVLGLSGGLDSAVVAVLCQKIAPLKVFMLPVASSNSKNLDDAFSLIKKFNLDYELINIEKILSSFEGVLNPDSKLRIGNIIARIRMICLYDLSAKHNSLVVGTSNKSELILGYGTIYGDLASALNPLGNLTKSEIFEFARYLKIPSCIIDKAPSADLWAGQSDEKDLGYSYAQIDKLILRANYLAKTNDVYELASLLASGKINEDLYKEFDKKLVDFINLRAKKNLFKLTKTNIAKIKE